MPNLTSAIQNAVPPEMLVVATSAVSFIRSLARGVRRGAVGQPDIMKALTKFAGGGNRRRQAPKCAKMVR